MELIIKHGNYGFYFHIEKEDYIILIGLDNYHNILDDIYNTYINDFINGEDIYIDIYDFINF
jgi:hypothetical protein